MTQDYHQKSGRIMATVTSGMYIVVLVTRPQLSLSIDVYHASAVVPEQYIWHDVSVL